MWGQLLALAGMRRVVRMRAARACSRARELNMLPTERISVSPTTHASILFHVSAEIAVPV